jgi:hypothetical protein
MLGARKAPVIVASGIGVMILVGLLGMRFFDGHFLKERQDRGEGVELEQQTAFLRLVSYLELLRGREPSLGSASSSHMDTRDDD